MSKRKKLNNHLKGKAFKLSKSGMPNGEIAIELQVYAAIIGPYLKKKWLKECNNMLSRYVIARDKWCVTCGSTKSLQAGHFIPGRHHSILFHPKNVHAQCETCNVWDGGNLIKYTIFMQEKYGQDVIDELFVLDKITKQFTIEDLREIYKDLGRKLFKEM